MFILFCKKRENVLCPCVYTEQPLVISQNYRTCSAVLLSWALGLSRTCVCFLAVFSPLPRFFPKGNKGLPGPGLFLSQRDRPTSSSTALVRLAHSLARSHAASSDPASRPVCLWCPLSFFLGSCLLLWESNCKQL